MHDQTGKNFTHRLQDWLNDKEPKTLRNLAETFGEKSFAIIFLLLMAIPALPIPTGGITHVFEIVVMLLAGELIIGRRSIWLPNKWLSLTLSSKIQSSTLPALIKLIRRVEKYTKPRLATTLNNPISIKLIAFIVIVFTLFAFLAPPFSGLDTIPALGVVMLSLALIFDDIVLGVVGLILGIVGVGLILTIGRLVFQLI